MYVKDFMTENVVALQSNARLGDAIQTMFESNIRHLPVVENGELVGILSDRDVIPTIMSSAKSAFIDEQRPVSLFMSPVPFTLTDEDTVHEAATQFIEHKYGAFPVVKTGSNELVGILSVLDLLKIIEEA